MKDKSDFKQFQKWWLESGNKLPIGLSSVRVSFFKCWDAAIDWHKQELTGRTCQNCKHGTKTKEINFIHCARNHCRIFPKRYRCDNFEPKEGGKE